MDRYTGTILKDRFVLEDIVGSGGMAIVYRATDRVTGNTVAVKILKEEFVSDEQFRRRFLNESRAISMLRHRNIVSVIDFDFEGNLQYIVMEYVDGITLKDFIRSQKIIPAGIAIKITMQILSALQHAHERGVIHRDIKPQNIMILNDGTIKVMDFGIARINKFETVTMTDKAIGTVYYISPEQARGEHTDERSDVYSIGVMLYEMLTGEMPFDGDTPVNVAIKQIQTAAKRPRTINRTIPVGLEQIVMRAMMKTPDKRYASAIDMVADLKKVLTDASVEFDYDLDEELPTGDMVPVPDEPKEKFWTKNNIIALCSGIAAGLVVIALIVVLFFVGGGNPGSTAPSSSTMAIEIPNFVGKLYTDVKDDQMLGDITVTAQEEYNADYDKGYIFEQSIVAGTEVQTGTEIIVKVSLGSKTITVPNIVDSEVESAIAALDKLGIDYQIIKQQSNDVKENYVIRTQPAADAEISEGKTLFVYVSTGSDAVMVEVPDLLGKDKNTAIMMLSAANLTYQIIDEEYSDTYKAGVIINQAIKAGTEVEEGREILLIISKGPNPSASSSSSSPEND